MQDRICDRDVSSSNTEKRAFLRVLLLFLSLFRRSGMIPAGNNLELEVFFE
jgi:hypothetical protein